MEGLCVWSDRVRVPLLVGLCDPLVSHRHSFVAVVADLNYVQFLLLVLYSGIARFEQESRSRILRDPAVRIPLYWNGAIHRR